MTIWLDNQLPAALAPWMRSTLSVECIAIRELNLQRASDVEIFSAARGARAVVFTKDADFTVSPSARRMTRRWRRPGFEIELGS